MIAWPQPKLVMAGTSRETLTAAMADERQCEPVDGRGADAYRSGVADHRCMSASHTTSSPTPSVSADDAGGFEQQRDRDGLRAWRRRVLPRLRWLVFPVVLGCVLFLVLGPVSRLQFPAGVLAGGLLALYLWVRDEPPEYISRHGVGAEGERSTDRVIAPLLSEGWRVAQDRH